VCGGNPFKELQHGLVAMPNLISLFYKIVNMFILGQVEYHAKLKLLHGIVLAYRSELDEGLYVFGEWIGVCF